jgi:ankyrin repeat protein
MVHSKPTTALMWAAMDGHVDAVTRQLLKSDCDVNAFDHHYKTALQYAVGSGSVECIDILMQHGASIYMGVKTTAFQNGDLACIRALIRHGATINSIDLETPMYNAKDDATCLEILELLFSHLNERFNGCHDGMIKLAERGFARSLDLVLKSKRIPPHRDVLNVALSDSVFYGHHECIDILVAYGADVHCISEYSKQNLLMIAANPTAGTEPNSKCIPLLLKHGLNINARDQYGKKTVLFHAVCGEYTESRDDFIRTLLHNGADMNARDANGKTAVMYLVSKPGRVNILDILVRYGVDLNVADKEGMTALMIAATIEKCDEYIKVLLKHGADAGALNKDGCSAIMLAGLNGYDNSVSILRKRKAY